MGESASIASSLPEATAFEASDCSWYWLISIADLPLSVHVFERALMSSTWTVPFWTATFLPHALSISTPCGLPFWTAHCVPALKYVAKLTTFWRSALAVNEEMPRPYLPDWMPGMIASNGELVNFISTPRTLPIALPRSMSMPTMSPPSTYSFGAYDASVPTSILPPSDDGTRAASVASFSMGDTVADALGEDSASEPPLLPQ